MTTASTTNWWASAVGYEVYIRSFADGNGDGVGDLHGLLDRLDHLAWLGVDVVWVTPFYPSPMRDHGYDVADYRGVEPVFGDLEVLDACITKAHDLGLRFMVDLVPNHSSSDHEWFRQSRSSRDNPYRDYYMWRDPAPDGGPPNNWVSVFGGPAWTLDKTTGQYWLHLFLAEQPDLNWDNPKVRDEFDDILRFWLDRGVDGFRIDVAHALVKHPDLPDNPPAEQAAASDAIATTSKDWETLEHIYDKDRPEVVDVYRRWQPLVAEYDAALLGEVYLLDGDPLERYLVDGDGLHLVFWFKPLHITWSAARVRDAIADGARLPAGRVAWVQGSHDRHRAATRYGGGELGRQRQLVMATVQFGMPGAVFVYQGEELGLEDGRLTLAEAQDPVALHEGDVSRGRDGCRTPIPWEPGPGMGFTTDAAEPWLPFGDRSDAETVAVQRATEGSMLHRYRELIGVRREVLADAPAAVEWLDGPDAVLAYRRGDAVVVANLEQAPVDVELPDGAWALRWSTGHAAVDPRRIRLDGTTAGVLTLG